MIWGGICWPCLSSLLFSKGCDHHRTVRTMTIPKRLDYMILVNWIKRCIYLTESRWCHFHRKAVLPNLQWVARAALRVVCQVFRYHRTRTWRAWTRLAETCNAEAPPCASRNVGKADRALKGPKRSRDRQLEADGKECWRAQGISQASNSSSVAAYLYTTVPIV